MKRIFAFSMCLCLAALPVYSIQRSELSPAAQALVPESGGMLTVQLKNGQKYEGVLSMETGDKVLLKVKKTETLFSTVPILKSDIVKMEPKDSAPVLFARLLEFKAGLESEQTEAQYGNAIALFDEFLKNTYLELFELVKEV